MRNPDLQQFSNAVTALKKNMETKELVNFFASMVGLVKSANWAWQLPGRGVRAISNGIWKKRS